MTTPQRKPPAADFLYFKPGKRRPTQYEEVTLHTQWDPKNYAAQGWFSRTSDGRPPWDETLTRLQANDWWGYRDPGQQWFRSHVELQSRHEEAIELAVEGAKRSGLFAEFAPAWLDILATYYPAYRYFEYGLFLSLCYVQREALSDVVAAPIVFESLAKDRHAQDIALYGMDLEEGIPGFSDAAAKQVWMEDPVYQPAREYIERLLACRDWGEIIIATNLVLEPLVSALFTREFLMRFAPHQGDSVTPVMMETVDADRRINIAATSELVRFVLAESPANREAIQEWIATWSVRAVRAAHAFAPLFERPANKPLTFAVAWQRIYNEWTALLKELTLSIPSEVQQ